MKKVIAFLQGGLGNQCFIYAAARAAALRAGAELALDGSYFLDDKIYKRRFALGDFNFAGEKLPNAAKPIRLFRKIRYVLLRDRVSQVGNYFCDQSPFVFRPLPANWHGALAIDGYFQSEKYFNDVADQILADFELKDSGWIEHDPIASQIRATENSVFLHVRSYKEVPGGEDGHCAMRLQSYYRDALAHLEGVLPSPGRVFVFSDDVEWAKTNVLSGIAEKSRFDFVFNGENSSQLRDFTLMRLCKHGILADSTFSWWAGWLGEREWIKKGAQPIRLHVNKQVLNADLWPDRWIAV